MIMIEKIETICFALFILCTIPSLCFAQYLTNAVHKTSAATERVNDLYCYSCETMEDGLNCADFSVGNYNFSHMIKKCKADEFVCMVKRFSYTMSNENVTTSPKMWSLERKCAVNCEPGCFSIGERTKLYACTSCCEKSLCNTGTGDSPKHVPSKNINLFFISCLLYQNTCLLFNFSKLFIFR
ncbi:uncharacterized protein LOC129607188 [Condylostylus longicornis]|uniref:uncharacterized protein LOC129607188 n=1 Tax=Condylostylus longicornis TaxID=2530218 RepID=UPI00244E441A|nr:uncharacterized protein LOC129607188 [Condylostylus longicornis]